jgi:hypothetical protein
MWRGNDVEMTWLWRGYDLAMTSEINYPLTIKRNYRKSLECTNLDHVPDIELFKKLEFLRGVGTDIYSVHYVCYVKGGDEKKFKVQRWKK